MPPAFDIDDFDVFTIGEFEPQMKAIRSRISPKLEAWGEALAPELEKLVEHPVFVHVARHMRRRTNPAPETWAAFASSKRGYKKLPVLSLCASQSGLQVRAMFKQEGAAARKHLPKVVKPQLEDILKQAEDQLTLRNFNSRKAAEGLPDPLPKGGTEAWEPLLERAALKTKSFDVGHALTPKQSAKLTIKQAMRLYRGLLPIYRALLECQDRA